MKRSRISTARIAHVHVPCPLQAPWLQTIHDAAGRRVWWRCDKHRAVPISYDLYSRVDLSCIPAGHTRRRDAVELHPSSRVPLSDTCLSISPRHAFLNCPAVDRHSGLLTPSGPSE